MNVFIICPVREVTPEERNTIISHVERLERSGHKVHWPERNTNQVGDPIGLRICTDNRRGIQQAHEVHVFWNGKSKGSFFDLGMAFMAEKPIRLINNVEPSETKSFENVLLALREMG